MLMKSLFSASQILFGDTLQGHIRFHLEDNDSHQSLAFYFILVAHSVCMGMALIGPPNKDKVDECNKEERSRKSVIHFFFMYLCDNVSY